MPITATPAAEPIIIALPPVPADRARKDQKALSTGYISRLNIPCAAATRGTLSITAESNPSIVPVIYSFLIYMALKSAILPKTPIT